jgi:protein-tyrosine phosphatase
MYVAWNFDDADVPDRASLDWLAELVARNVNARRNTVVYCAGGLNRSALVAAKALVILGHEPPAAVELIRRARGRWALSNLAFERALLETAEVRPDADS